MYLTVCPKKFFVVFVQHHWFDLCWFLLTRQINPLFCAARFTVLLLTYLYEICFSKNNDLPKQTSLKSIHYRTSTINQDQFFKLFHRLTWYPFLSLLQFLSILFALASVLRPLQNLLCFPMLFCLQIFCFQVDPLHTMVTSYYKFEWIWITSARIDGSKHFDRNRLIVGLEKQLLQFLKCFKLNYCSFLLNGFSRIKNKRCRYSLW